MRFWIIGYDINGKEVLGSSGTCIARLKTAKGALARARRFHWHKSVAVFLVYQVPESDKYNRAATCWHKVLGGGEPILFDC